MNIMVCLCPPAPITSVFCATDSSPSSATVFTHSSLDSLPGAGLSASMHVPTYRLTGMGMRRDRSPSSVSWACYLYPCTRIPVDQGVHLGPEFPVSCTVAWHWLEDCPFAAGTMMEEKEKGRGQAVGRRGGGIIFPFPKAWNFLKNKKELVCDGLFF